ncbi:MAG: heme exporter protein CcmD [Gammaproteobacteria bacterium]|nr:heme exporter protein CcmD [Gammaproteobacteria bacterium]
MIWESWSDFFAMGGYAFYVWGSYAVTAVLMIVEVIMVMRRHRATRAHLARTVSTEPNEG